MSDECVNTFVVYAVDGPGTNEAVRPNVAMVETGVAFRFVLVTLVLPKSA